MPGYLGDWVGRGGRDGIHGHVTPPGRRALSPRPL